MAPNTGLLCTPFSYTPHAPITPSFFSPRTCHLCPLLKALQWLFLLFLNLDLSYNVASPERPSLSTQHLLSQPPV